MLAASLPALQLRPCVWNWGEWETPGFPQSPQNQGHAGCWLREPQTNPVGQEGEDTDMVPPPPRLSCDLGDAHISGLAVTLLAISVFRVRAGSTAWLLSPLIDSEQVPWTL